MAGALAVPPLLTVAVLPLLKTMIQESSVSLTEVIVMPSFCAFTTSHRPAMSVLTLSSSADRRLLMFVSSLCISLSSNFTHDDTTAVTVKSTSNNRATMDLVFILVWRLDTIFSKIDIFLLTDTFLPDLSSPSWPAPLSCHPRFPLFSVMAGRDRPSPHSAGDAPSSGTSPSF